MQFFVPGGTNSVATIAGEPDAIHFLNEAYRHCKAIAVDKEAMQVIEETAFYKKLPKEISAADALETGIVISSDMKELSGVFIKAIAQHRFWDRENSKKVPA